MASTENFESVVARSKQDPSRFWLEAAGAIDWDVAPTVAVDDSDAPLYRWFPDARLNTSYNALDRHVLAGRGDDTIALYQQIIAADPTRLDAVQELVRLLISEQKQAEALAALEKLGGDPLVTVS